MSKVLRIAKDLFDIFYPIGSYYETSNADWTPQGAGWYGTWVEDSAGKTTVAQDAGTFKTLGSSVGEESHTLTVNEIPSHRHVGLSWLGDDISQSITLNGGSSGKRYNLQYYGGYVPGQEKNIHTRATGGGQAHNNIQPSVVVRRWHRTA